MATSISSQIDLYKFNEHIDVLLNTFSDKLQLAAELNGKNIIIPNVPLWLNKNLNAKFDRPEQMALSFGSTREFVYLNHSLSFCFEFCFVFCGFFSDMCSIISPILSTFDDKPISLENYTKSNCSVLLVADCSSAARFALFVKPSNGNGYSLQLYIGDNVVSYAPRANGLDMIQLKNSTEVPVQTMIQPLGESIDLR